MRISNEDLGKKMIEWMLVPENFLVSEFAVNEGMSMSRMSKIASEDENFREDLEIAKTIEMVKVAKGALSGQLKGDVALRLLGTFHNWKEESKVSTNVAVFQGFMDEELLRMANATRINNTSVAIDVNVSGKDSNKKLIKAVSDGEKFIDAKLKSVDSRIRGGKIGRIK